MNRTRPEDTGASGRRQADPQSGCAPAWGSATIQAMIPSIDPAEEARFWDARQTPDSPDHRLRRRLESPEELWEDPEVEAIARGRFVDRIMAACEPPPRDLLELACGCGWLSLELARRGHRVHAIDLSPERIESARLYAESLRASEPNLGGLTYEVADLNTVALTEGRFDRVICWDGLHHIHAIRRLMAEIDRSLRPGGRLIIFDHIGPANALQSAIDRGIALFIVALQQPGNLRRTIRRNRGAERAPSEDVTGVEMITAARSVFGDDRVAVETALATGKRWLARLRGPRSIRLGLVRFHCALDRAAIRLRLARGEYLFLEAVKRDPGDSC